MGIAQNVASAPDRLDVVVAAGGCRQLLAELADEHVHDLEFRFVEAAVEVVEDHVKSRRPSL
jgi:hypothetical protein